MDEELPLDTLELPYEPPDVQEEPEVGAAGRAKAVAKVPKPIPVDILLRASCPLRQNSDIEQFVNNVASHYDVSDDVQAPGVPVDDVRVGMKRAAMNISTRLDPSQSLRSSSSHLAPSTTYLKLQLMNCWRLYRM